MSLVKKKKKTADPTQFKEPGLRIWKIEPEVLLTLDRIGKALQEKTRARTVIRLIERYEKDQKLIADVSARNADLHRKLAKYVGAEEVMRRTIENFAKDVLVTAKRAISTSKLYSKQLAVRTKKSPAAAGAPGKPVGNVRRSSRAKTQSLPFNDV